MCWPFDAERYASAYVGLRILADASNGNAVLTTNRGNGVTGIMADKPEGNLTPKCDADTRVTIDIPHDHLRLILLLGLSAYLARANQLGEALNTSRASHLLMDSMGPDAVLAMLEALTEAHDSVCPNVFGSTERIDTAPPQGKPVLVLVAGSPRGMKS